MTNYYGCDSNSTSFPSRGSDFYIGKTGSGTSTTYTAFNTGMAGKVGYSSTWSYWGLYGPFANMSNPSNSDAYNFGKKQGNAAYQAWLSGDYASYVGGRTIFADIESPAFPGWKSGSSYYDLNRQVLAGFRDAVVENYLEAGVYSNSDYDSFMGSTWSPTNVNEGNCSALWGANYPNSSANCDWYPSSYSPNNIGGITPTIWQYIGYPGTQCKNDFNWAILLPN